MKTSVYKFVSLRKNPTMQLSESKRATIDHIEISSLQSFNQSIQCTALQPKSLYIYETTRKNKTTQSLLPRNMVENTNGKVTIKKLPSISSKKQRIPPLQMAEFERQTLPMCISSIITPQTRLQPLLTSRESKLESLIKEGERKELLGRVLSKVKIKLNDYKKRHNLLMRENKRLKEELGRLKELTNSNNT